MEILRLNPNYGEDTVTCRCVWRFIESEILSDPSDGHLEKEVKTNSD